MINRIKEYIKYINLDWDDLFLFVGFLFSVPFYAFSWQYMVTSDPNEIFFKLWMIIVCASITISCWACYFYIQIKKGTVKLDVPTIIFLFLLILGAITVLIQPSTYVTDMVLRPINAINNPDYVGPAPGTIVQITASISPTHRAMFFFAGMFITTIFYIVIYVLPRRIKTMNFVIIVGIVIYIFLFVLAFYSYITESEKYIPFVKALFEGDFNGVYQYAVYSFIVHRVPYGVCMMLGITYAIVSHGITKKWYFYLIIAFLYVNMVFSYCKSALLITTLMIAVYVIVRLIETFKEHAIRNKILFGICGGGVVVIIMLFAISYFSKGKYVNLFYKIIESFTGSVTLDSRKNIWDNTFHLLQSGWWIIGRGFGTYNTLLYPMNYANNDYVCPSHSTYNAVLGAGGIFALFAFLALIFYYIHIFIKCFRYNKFQSIELSICAFGYIVYSFTEGVNYLILALMFPLIVYYQLNKDKMANL